ncbi:hypothetical protein OG455_23880 [Kitasatospora sp. NBC_01287]|uniref:hypothetical protein n=1 Tax=Kitasatospora sp. NBC_01287 TaxID=2903573 RepID=UPI00224D2B08|nr:hypothetical protein [Kitasatospora sp. NBC_01287]MCX4748518.1 hypothetical protein [Kitasatospora sp. NBC_01287]
MKSSTPVTTTEEAAQVAGRVPMNRLLAATAAAAAVCTPPRPGERSQATTWTRVPFGAKSQSV